MTDKELENHLEDNFDEYEEVSGDESKEIRAALENTPVKKDKRITLRLNEDLLKTLKYHAKEAGIPYQTFIGSLLTQAVSRPTVNERLQSLEQEVKNLKSRVS